MSHVKHVTLMNHKLNKRGYTQEKHELGPDGDSSISVPGLTFYITTVSAVHNKQQPNQNCPIQYSELGPDGDSSISVPGLTFYISTASTVHNKQPNRLWALPRTVSLALMETAPYLFLA